MRNVLACLGRTPQGLWREPCSHAVGEVLRVAETVERRAGGISAMIERLARERCAVLEKQLDYNDSMSPIEYESYCARLLDKIGWAAQVTNAPSNLRLFLDSFRRMEPCWLTSPVCARRDVARIARVRCSIPSNGRRQR